MTVSALRTLADLRRAHDALLAQLQRSMQERAAGSDDVLALRALAGEIGAFVDAAVQLGAFIGTEFIDDRTAAQVIVDYWTGKLSHATGVPVMRELAAFDPATNTVLPDEECPYPGEGPVSADRPLLGRDREVQELLASIERWPLAVVTGPAGCGKSSLVHAGVLPALRARRGGDGEPRWQVPDPVPARLPAVQAAIAAAGAAPALVLTLDPVDALFADEPRAGPGAAGTALADVAAAVDRLLAAQPGRRVVMLTREEHVAQLREVAALARWLDPPGPVEEGAPPRVITVGPLTPAALRRAITEPAERVGLQVHPDVVDAVVAKVAGQRSALRLLQYAARQIWKARDGHLVGRAAAEGLKHEIELRRLQLEAEWLSTAVAREHEHVEQAEAIAAAQAQLARREHRARVVLSGVVAGLVAAAIGLAVMLRHVTAEGKAVMAENARVVDNVVAQANGRFARERDALQVERDALQAERDALRAERDALRVERDGLLAEREARPVARAAAPPPAATRERPRPPAPPAPAAARPPSAVPRLTAPDAPRERPAASAAATAAAPAPAPARVDLAPAPAAAPSAPALSTSPAAPVARAPAGEPMSEGEKLLRASRLVYWLDTGKVASRLEPVRREYPVSWTWAKGRWSELQLTTPLALAVLFDTSVAQGPLQAALIRASAAPTGGDLRAEQALVASYLDSREKRKDDALNAALEPERIARLRRLVREGDWALDGLPALLR